jgi:hypothetical protein
MPSSQSIVFGDPRSLRGSCRIAFATFSFWNIVLTWASLYFHYGFCLVLVALWGMVWSVLFDPFLLTPLFGLVVVSPRLGETTGFP